ncbi:MAG: CvpA family protein [Planctomycetaceae bacterium]
MIVNILLVIVFLAVTLVLFREGLWSGLVMFLNLLAATTAATAWYPTVANLVDGYLPSFTYLIDFLCWWGLFALILLVMREVTDRMSRTKVKFVKQVELVGGAIVGMLAGWLMVCFTAASLHTAAVPRNLVQPTPEATMFFGLAPDRKWLAWARHSTWKGPFGHPGADEARVFDKDARFILGYADRRAALERVEGLRVNRE